MNIGAGDQIVVPLTLPDLRRAQAGFHGTACSHPEPTGGQDGAARLGAVAGAP